MERSVRERVTVNRKKWCRRRHDFVPMDKGRRIPASIDVPPLR
jgi:hypothetical protein